MLTCCVVFCTLFKRDPAVSDVGQYLRGQIPTAVASFREWWLSPSV